MKNLIKVILAGLIVLGSCRKNLAVKPYSALPVVVKYSNNHFIASRDGAVCGTSETNAYEAYLGCLNNSELEREAEANVREFERILKSK